MSWWPGPSARVSGELTAVWLVGGAPPLEGGFPGGVPIVPRVGTPRDTVRTPMAWVPHRRNVFQAKSDIQFEFPFSYFVNLDI